MNNVSNVQPEVATGYTGIELTLSGVLPEMVLLIESDTFVCAQVHDLLHRGGIAVHCCHSGAEAQAASPDLAVSAVVVGEQLEDGSGVALLPALKQQHPEAYFVVTSSKHDVAAAVGALREGVDAYFAAPFDGRLLLKLRQHLSTG